MTGRSVYYFGGQKMKFIKKTAAIFLALLLSIAVMPSAFAADNGVIASGEAGEGITWTLTGSGVLTVSGA